MFYIENEEEYERAIRILEGMYAVEPKVTTEMKEIKQAIEDWEAKNDERDQQDIL